MIPVTRALAAGVSAIALAASAAAQTAPDPAAVPQAADSYFVAARSELQQIIARQPNVREARNVILFIGDGMSVPTVTAARIFEGQQRGVDGESNVLAFERLLPHVALSKTYTHDAQVADSAPTATAMVAGVKSVNGTIGVTQEVEHDVCASQQGHEVTTIFETAEAAGWATGIVSTARITHATPAAAYANTANRDWENGTEMPETARAEGCKDIAAQLVDWPAGNGFEVILGGGRANFMLDSQADPEHGDKTGKRTDGRDLIDAWQARYNDGTYVWNEAGFEAVDPATTGHLLGLFEQSHMQYETDRDTSEAGEPSLAEMTAKAIDVLSRNDRGFLLMVEAGRIDHAHHAGNAFRALEDTIALSEAVQAAYDKVDPEETLIIVTADHSHVFTMAGYPDRNNPILGIAGEGDDHKPYTTLGYQNGPGAVEGARADLTDVDTTVPDFLQQALVPLVESETHAGDDVAIYAQGPWAHLFDGVMEQNMIYHVIAQATGLPQKAALVAVSN
jgi:alkaline phosphatase